MSINKSLLAGVLGISLLLMGVFCEKNNHVTTTNNNTNSNGTVTDADGNVYQTVKIGDQIWTVENLRTTKYNDGTPIPHVTESVAWEALTTPAYCYYNNTTNADTINKFGALYNWYAINTGKLAPAGWHVPTFAEWNTLERFLFPIASNDLTMNNKSGFSALPGGFRDRYGHFMGIGGNGWWWSATEADNKTMDQADQFTLTYSHNSESHIDFGDKFSAYSVRLVKDSLPTLPSASGTSIKHDEGAKVISNREQDSKRDAFEEAVENCAHQATNENVSYEKAYQMCREYLLKSGNF